MSYLGENIKKLGFGLMRLPKNGEIIDVEQVKSMVDKFLAAGFTYFDTAWAYAGSEDAIRQALVERYPRESFQLATKNAAWINCKTREEAIAQFDTSLRQTGAGYFDFYLLHNLGESRTRFFDDFDMWRFVQEKKQEGLIRHVDFPSILRRKSWRISLRSIQRWNSSSCRSTMRTGKVRPFSRAAVMRWPESMASRSSLWNR